MQSEYRRLIDALNLYKQELNSDQNSPTPQERIFLYKQIKQILANTPIINTSSATAIDTVINELTGNPSDLKHVKEIEQNLIDSLLIVLDTQATTLSSSQIPENLDTLVKEFEEATKQKPPSTKFLKNTKRISKNLLEAQDQASDFNETTRQQIRLEDQFSATITDLTVQAAAIEDESSRKQFIKEKLLENPAINTIHSENIEEATNQIAELSANSQVNYNHSSTDPIENRVSIFLTTLSQGQIPQDQLQKHAHQLSQELQQVDPQDILLSETIQSTIDNYVQKNQDLREQIQIDQEELDYLKTESQNIARSSRANAIKEKLSQTFDNDTKITVNQVITETPYISPQPLHELQRIASEANQEMASETYNLTPVKYEDALVNRITDKLRMKAQEPEVAPLFENGQLSTTATSALLGIKKQAGNAVSEIQRNYRINPSVPQSNYASVQDIKKTATDIVAQEVKNGTELNSDQQRELSNLYAKIIDKNTTGYEPYNHAIIERELTRARNNYLRQNGINYPEKPVQAVEQIDNFWQILQSKVEADQYQSNFGHLQKTTDSPQDVYRQDRINTTSEIKTDEKNNKRETLVDQINNIAENIINPENVSEGTYLTEKNRTDTFKEQQLKAKIAEITLETSTIPDLQSRSEKISQEIIQAYREIYSFEEPEEVVQLALSAIKNSRTNNQDTASQFTQEFSERFKTAPSPSLVNTISQIANSTKRLTSEEDLSGEVNNALKTFYGTQNPVTERQVDNIKLQAEKLAYVGNTIPNKGIIHSNDAVSQTIATVITEISQGELPAQVVEKHVKNINDLLNNNNLGISSYSEAVHSTIEKYIQETPELSKKISSTENEYIRFASKSIAQKKQEGFFQEALNDSILPNIIASVDQSVAYQKAIPAIANSPSLNTNSAGSYQVQSVLANAVQNTITNIQTDPKTISANQYEKQFATKLQEELAKNKNQLIEHEIFDQDGKITRKGEDLIALASRSAGTTLVTLQNNYQINPNGRKLPNQASIEELNSISNQLIDETIRSTGVSLTSVQRKELQSEFNKILDKNTDDYQLSDRNKVQSQLIQARNSFLQKNKLVNNADEIRTTNFSETIDNYQSSLTLKQEAAQARLNFDINGTTLKETHLGNDEIKYANYYNQRRAMALDETLDSPKEEVRKLMLRKNLTEEQFIALAKQSDDISPFLSAKLEKVIDRFDDKAYLVFDSAKSSRPDLARALHLDAQTQIKNEIIVKTLAKLENIQETDNDTLRTFLVTELTDQFQSTFSKLGKGTLIDFNPGSKMNHAIVQIADNIIAEGSIKTVATLKSIAPYTAVLENTIDPNIWDNNTLSIDKPWELNRSYKVRQKGDKQIYLTDDVLELELMRRDSTSDLATLLAKASPGLAKNNENNKIASAIIGAIYGKVVVFENDDGELEFKNFNGNLFTETQKLVSTSEKILMGTMNDEEREKFLQSLAIRNQKYLFSSLTVQVLKYIEEQEKEGKIEKGTLNKLSNLTYRDIYSDFDLETFALRAKKEGRSFNPDGKLNFQDALTYNIKSGLHYDNILKKMQKIQERERIQSDIGFNEYMTAGNFFDDSAAFAASLNPNVLGARAKNTVLNFTPHLFSTQLKLAGYGNNTDLAFTIAYASGKLRYVENPRTGKWQPAGFENGQLTNLITKLRLKGIAIDHYLNLGYIPNGVQLGIIERIMVENALSRKKALDLFTEKLNNKQVNKLVRFFAWRKEQQRTLKGGAINAAFNTILSQDLTILPRYGYGLATRTTTNFLLRKSGLWDYDAISQKMYFRPYKELKVSIKSGIKSTLGKVWERTGKIVLNAAWNTLKATKTGAKIAASLAKAGTIVTAIGVRAIPVVGWIYALVSLVDFVLGKIPIIGEIYKGLKELLKLAIVGTIYLIQMFFTWIANAWMAAALLFNPLSLGAWLGAKFSGSLGFSSAQSALSSLKFTGGFGATGGSFSLGLSGTISGFFSSIFPGLGSISVSSILSLPSALVSALTSMSIPALATTITFVTGTTFGLMYHFGLMTAIKDGPDKLTGTIAVAINPLQISKTADKTQAVNNDIIKYSINVKSIPCDSTLIVEDIVPNGATFYNEDGLVPGHDPSTFPENSIIQSVTDPFEVDASNKLTWVINIKPDQINGPCSASTGSSVGGLRDPNYLTADQIKSLISSSVFASNPKYTNENFNSIDDIVNLIIEQANTNNVNPMLVLAIFQRETQLGLTGPGQPNLGGRIRPKLASYGCNNLGNMRPGDFATSYGANPSATACIFGKATGPDDPFALFPNYEGSIKATFGLMKVYLDDGLTTVGQIADRYSPAGDCTVGCDVGATKNAEFKAIVGCSVARKEFCSDPTVTDVEAAQTLNINLFYYAKVNTDQQMCIINTAYARIGNPANGDVLTNQASAITGANGMQCNQTAPLPPGDVAATMQFMCNHPLYKVCPTIGAKYPPASKAWTREQLEALWRVAQKVYQAEPYRSYAVGNYGIEVQRSRCYYYRNKLNCPPADGDNTQGFNQGTDGGYATVQLPGTIGTKVILIMDTINSINSYPKILDYLYAHEIAHSAQWGNADGGINEDRTANLDNGPVFACNEVVSTYGKGSIFENNADAISYYMTEGETGNNYRSYSGNTNNLKTDHPCTYNALKNGFFRNKVPSDGAPMEYDLY